VTDSNEIRSTDTGGSRSIPLRSGVKVPILHIDFETRSAEDLKERGVHDYAKHPTTSLWCAAYAFDEEEPDVWLPPDPMPKRLRQHVESGGEIRAYNAQFERVLWREVLTPRYGWAEPKLEQFHCVMARAYALALPGDLGGAAAAVGIDAQKDGAGQRLMLQMCRPRSEKPLVWWDQPEKLDRLIAYCKQDVIVERELDKRLLQLSSSEIQVYQLDQRINDRGVKIDRALVQSAIKVVAETQERLDKEMHTLTRGQVSRCSKVEELKRWLGTQKVEVESVNKAALLELLDGDLPEKARKALELRHEGSKTSTAKLKQLLARSERDGTMRGNLQYHGAGTGRWAARGAQLQNLPKPTKGRAVDDTMVKMLATGKAVNLEVFYGRPLTVVSDCIRSMIVAPEGGTIVAADFSSVEARGVAWLAGQEDKLERFRAGEDLYCLFAAAIYGRPITKKDNPTERDVGKVGDLAGGYGGGVGAFGKMAKANGIDLDKIAPAIWESASVDIFDKAAEAYDKRKNGFGLSRQAWIACDILKHTWRGQNPRIKQLWRDLEDAAIEAVASPGRETGLSNGLIRYRRVGSFLFCRLPSGRCISYPYPRLEEKETPWGSKVSGIVYKSVNSITKRWEDHHFYGGLAAENVTQALCRDIMAEAMQRVEKAGYSVVLTVHDEVVTYSYGKGDLKEFTSIITHAPGWCLGMPLAAEAWAGPRYKKG
jgi:DNA polymerase